MSVWILVATAWATTRDVGPGQPYATIQGAVDAAVSGDTIAVHPSTYTEAVLVDGKDLVISALGAVVLQGQSVDLLTIRGGATSVLGLTLHPDGGRGVQIDGATVTLANVEISGNRTGRQAFDGAALLVRGSSDVTLSNCHLFDNQATSSPTTDGVGGHVLVRDGALLIRGSTLTGGVAVEGGAVRAEQRARLTIEDTVLEDNVASNIGGAISLSGALFATLTEVTLHHNTAGDTGGGVDVEAAVVAPDLTLDRCTLLANIASQQGGGVAFRSPSTLRMDGVSAASNSGRDGGGVYANRAIAVELVRTSMCGNSANREGGAISFESVDTITVSASEIYENQARTGGGFVIYGGDVDIHNSTFAGNDATTGGAVRASPTTMVFENNLVAYTPRGRGLDVSIPVTVTYSDFFQNLPSDATASVSLGAGTFAADPLLQRFAVDGRCEDLLRPQLASPLINAGSPAIFDLDGTRSDVGAWGGPDAPSADEDSDGDGTIDLFDCAPEDPLIHPGATERCDGVDNNCDGDADTVGVVGAPTWFPDGDRDAWGGEPGVVACTQPPRTADVTGDCDDSNRAVNPDAIEVCDGLDNDCRDGVDANAVDMLAWYEDADSDGYGTASRAITSCAQPAGYVLSNSDCDDTSSAISPASEELCNAIDDDCDRSVDEDPADGLSWYADGDGDGYGAAGEPIIACVPPAGYGDGGDDCDDADPAVHPFAPEDCSAPVDRNCDGSTGQQDLDADGFVACEDCDDSDASVFPGAPDAPYDGVRRDCDRSSDFDADADGHDALGFGGDDCNDDDAGVHPGTPDLANGVDDDCDELVDEDDDATSDPGCGGCSSGGLPTAAPLTSLALLLAARRRKRSLS